MEPYLDSFSADGAYLRTSPELHMKRLVARGFERIFQIGPCFRKGDRGRWHAEEFSMLEWYRSFCDLDALADECAELLAALAPLARDREYFRRTPRRVTCVELFREFAGVELVDDQDPAPLLEACRAHGVATAADDDWDDLFFRLFLDLIEPRLGVDRPVFLFGYPARQAALAKKAPPRPGRLPTCYRFEIFLSGLELANAFYELTDPVEQRARFEEDRRIRAAAGKPVYAIDEDFMAALEAGLPPMSGIALGVDRLVAALLACEDLSRVRFFRDVR
jgi:lysyl-tRNA synthetase class 2